MIENEVAKILIDKSLTVAVTESCTGGLISSLLTDVSGSSGFVFQNFVTYSNESKTRFLSVDESILATKGAVSYEVAKQMAEGLLKNYQTDLAVSTTGIAGPTGGSKEKPVGLVFIGIADKKSAHVVQYKVCRFLPRRIIKFLFAKKALKELKEFLKRKKYD